MKAMRRYRPVCRRLRRARRRRAAVAAAVEVQIRALPTSTTLVARLVAAGALVRVGDIVCDAATWQATERKATEAIDAGASSASRAPRVSTRGITDGARRAVAGRVRRRDVRCGGRTSVRRRIRPRGVGDSPRVASARLAGTASGGGRETGFGAGGQAVRSAVAQGPDARRVVPAGPAFPDRDRRGGRDQRGAGDGRAGRQRKRPM